MTNRFRKTLRWLVFLVCLCAGLACNFVSNRLEGGSVPASPPAAAVNLQELTGSRELPLARSDKKSYKPEQFAARSIPVEVSFTGEATAEVLFKGALTAPNWSKSATPPEKLEVFLVFQNNDAPLIHRDGDTLYMSYWDVDLVIHLFDASGGLLASLERNPGVFEPNFPQAFRVYIDEIPGGVASVAVEAALVMGRKGAGCFAGGGEGYQLPDPMFKHSPIKIELQMDDWNEKFAQKAVVAGYNLVYQNPYNQDLAPNSIILFLDDAGALVGYMDHDVFIPAHGTYTRRNDEPWQSSYLSGVPTRALIFDDIPLCTLYEAMK